MDKYITYEEYTTYSSADIGQDSFDKFVLRAQLKLDFITFNRIKYLEPIPECVKILLCDIINLLFTAENGDKEQGLKTLTSYSNGIESFGYSASSNNKSKEQQINDSIKVKAEYYLSEYPWLLYRGIR